MQGLPEDEREALRRFIVSAPTTLAAAQQLELSRETMLAGAVGVRLRPTTREAIRGRLRKLRIV